MLLISNLSLVFNIMEFMRDRLHIIVYDKAGHSGVRSALAREYSGELKYAISSASDDYQNRFYINGCIKALGARAFLQLLADICIIALIQEGMPGTWVRDWMIVVRRAEFLLIVNCPMEAPKRPSSLSAS